MKPEIEYRMNCATETDISQHLHQCDGSFVPPLSARTVIGDYARKIVQNSVRFEAWAANSLIALVAVYCNDMQRRVAFITNVSVDPLWHRRGVASRLMHTCVDYVVSLGFAQTELAVDASNAPAIQLYSDMGFEFDADAGKATLTHTKTRDHA